MDNELIVKNNLNELLAHDRNFLYNDGYLDQLVFGVDLDKLNQGENIYTQKFDEQITHEPTPYYYIATFIKFLQPNKNDTIYDLGSGYGRVILFGASISNAKFIGIEIIKERVEFATKRANDLGLQNAVFCQSNVKNADLSQGDIFFLFNPFLESTLHEVGAELKRVATQKPIKVACWGGLSIFNYFRNEKWLSQIFPPKNLRIEKLSYFYSL